MPKLCQKLNCTRNCYGEYCLMHKPRKAIKGRDKLSPPLKRSALPQQRKALPSPTKRIKQRGKQYDIWQAVRKSWIERHPARTYICHYCSKVITLEELTLDHKEPKSRYKEDRHADSNLVPCCFTCNGLKGSVDHDKYKHVCHT